MTAADTRNFHPDPRKQAAPAALTVAQLSGLDLIPAADWDRMAHTDNPFLSHAFLQGLEQFNCLEPHGWTPSHLAVYADGQAVGALPLYLKSNSYGEFIFDWSWADAYERAGGRYYPKLVSAIPFTPVQGPRILIDQTRASPEAVTDLLLRSVMELTESTGISSFHCLLPEPASAYFRTQPRFLARKSIQFHWHNQGYRDFDDFLDQLTSKKRKQIKRERRQVREAGIEIDVLAGDRISPEQWGTFHEFYCSTFHRRWGSPRLTLEFFQSLSNRLPGQTLLLLARKNQRYVAGAFAMRGADTLYGRHWGCAGRHEFLHFELCYYQTIEYCINHRLATMDAGVQGEHKLSRGFEPVVTASYHWIRHPGFRKAIQDFLVREGAGIDAYVRELAGHLPFKHASAPATGLAPDLSA